MFVLKKKYDLLNKEYLLLNDRYESLKCNYEKSWIENKEYKRKVLKLENNNEALRLEKMQLEDEIKSLNQEIDLYDKDLDELRKENEELERAKKILSKMWNDLNRKLWCNGESKRQLRKLSKEIISSDKINKNYIASYLEEISLYINEGIKAEIKFKEE